MAQRAEKEVRPIGWGLFGAYELGRTPESVLEGHEGLALAVISAGLARQNKQGVVKDPLPDEPAHAHVIGKKKKASRVMAKASQWVVDPGLPPPAD